MSVNNGSSLEASICATRTSFLSELIAALRASTDLALPTNNVVTTPGKTTRSRKGMIG